MNLAASLHRVNPWIVVALAAALILLAVTALVLLVEPGLLHTIRIALHGQQMADCGGSVGTHC
jgi:hypothetical protein